jgi:hypothetical protein
MAGQFQAAESIERVQYVEPTGVGSIDTSALLAAISRVNATGRGIVELVDTGSNLVLNQAAPGIEFGSCGLVGSDRTKIETQNGCSLNFGTWFDPNNGATAVTGGIAQNAFTFTKPASISLSVGDAVMLFADDNLNNVIEPHVAAASGGQTRPAEIYRVIEIIGSTVSVDTPAIDAMTINPRMHKLAAHPKVRIENFELIGSGGADGSINIYSTVDSVLKNVRLNGAGQITCLYNHNLLIEEVDIFKVKFQAGIYGIVLGVNSQVIIRNCNLASTRHVVTTGGFSLSGDANKRYGTGKGYLVERCTASGVGEGITGGVVAFDSHPEVYGMIFDGCRVSDTFLNPSGFVYGFSTRARNTIIRNCHVHMGDGNSIAYNIVAPDCIVHNCTSQGGWIGARLTNLRSSPTTQADRGLVKGCIFRKAIGAGVHILQGRGHHVVGNEFPGCGSYGGGGHIGQSKVAVGAELTGIVSGGTTTTTRVQIRGNCLDKENNLNSVANGDMDQTEMNVIGNSCYGYGAGSIGVSGGAAFDTAYAGDNFHD